MDELVIDNLVYIPSKKAALITGYAKDYVGQLCREGRIEAKLVGRSWYVLESSVREHRFGKGGSAELAPPIRQEVIEAREEVVPQPPSRNPEPVEVMAEEKVSLRTWEPASYSSEAVESLPVIDHPTYLTNTPPETSQVSQIEEVQNAWQEWFSKNQVPTEGMRVQGTVTPSSEVDEEVVPEPVEEESESLEEQEAPEFVVIPTPVRINRAYAGSMDIEPEVVVKERTVPVQRQGRVVSERRVKRKSQRGKSMLTYKAVFIGIIILTLAVTVIGTGTLDQLSPTWASKTPPINFLAGVTSLEK